MRSQLAQGTSSGPSSASAKPGQKRPRAPRQDASKRTGACARCRRLKVRLAISVLCGGIPLIVRPFGKDEMHVYEPRRRSVLALQCRRVRVRFPWTEASLPNVSPCAMRPVRFR